MTHPRNKDYHRQLIIRTIRNTMWGIMLIELGLFAGMFGYHFFEGMSWIDAFVNAAMILSGMGPLGPLLTFSGKLFAGCYALFSGLFFILVIGLIFAPLASHYFKMWHLEVGK